MFNTKLSKLITILIVFGFIFGTIYFVGGKNSKIPKKENKSTTATTEGNLLNITRSDHKCYVIKFEVIEDDTTLEIRANPEVVLDCTDEKFSFVAVYLFNESYLTNQYNLIDILTPELSLKLASLFLDDGYEAGVHMQIDYGDVNESYDNDIGTHSPGNSAYHWYGVLNSAGSPLTKGIWYVLALSNIQDDQKLILSVVFDKPTKILNESYSDNSFIYSSDDFYGTLNVKRALRRHSTERTIIDCNIEIASEENLVVCDFSPKYTRAKSYGEYILNYESSGEQSGRAQFKATSAGTGNIDCTVLDGTFAFPYPLIGSGPGEVWDFNIENGKSDSLDVFLFGADIKIP